MDDSQVRTGPSRAQSARSAPAAGAIWLDGEVLACACPQCGAPMSIRLWLMTADCLRCGAGIELTEQQQREAERLLRARQEARRQETQRAAETIRPTAVPTKAHAPAAPHAAPRRSVAKRPARPPCPSHAAHAAPARRRAPTVRSFLLGPLLRLLPPWLISLVLHLVAILMLGLWTLRLPQDALGIHLSTAVAYQDVLGDEAVKDDPLDEAFEFDDAGSTQPVDLPVEAVAPGNTLAAPKLPDVDLPQPIGALPDSASQSMATIPAVQMGRMFAGRDPELRAGRLSREGGTSATEAAVARGLRWISRHQNRDGSWSLHAFAESPECQGRCGGHGGVPNDVAATALALLPMLGAGQTHEEGQYTKQVDTGLRWLVKRQRPNGDLRGTDVGRSMYGQGLAAIVLCEAYGMTHDEALRQPAQKALSFIAAAQHSDGGWRYEPNQPGDTSVVGWQLMALRSGQMAYLVIPRDTFSRADRYLDDAQADRVGGRYGYMPGAGPTPTMTAEALLCREYLGWPKDHAGLRSGVDYLLDHLPQSSEPNVYYWYYGTQVLYHLGGRPWRRWNAAMQQTLLTSQEKQDHQAGSWEPRGQFSPQGGRLYTTSLAVCTLEVYYRHLPLYRPGALAY